MALKTVETIHFVCCLRLHWQPKRNNYEFKNLFWFSLTAVLYWIKLIGWGKKPLAATVSDWIILDKWAAKIFAKYHVSTKCIKNRSKCMYKSIGVVLWFWLKTFTSFRRIIFNWTFSCCWCSSFNHSPLITFK